MYSEALSPWLHATPEYHGATLPEWHDTSTDTMVEEAPTEPVAFSPDMVAPPPEPVMDMSENVPGYRYTSIIDSTIPEESFEMSHSASGPLSPAPPADVPAASSPELIGLGMSGTVAGFLERQAYLKQLGYVLPTPPAPAPAAEGLAKSKPTWPYRMPPIEELRIHKQDSHATAMPSHSSSAERDMPRAARAISGASFVLSPTTAMVEQAWQPAPPPPPIMRPRIPSIGEQETVVTDTVTPTHLPVRLPDTLTYSPPLQTIHIVRGSPPPWATPSPRTDVISPVDKSTTVVVQSVHVPSADVASPVTAEARAPVSQEAKSAGANETPITHETHLGPDEVTSAYENHQEAETEALSPSGPDTSGVYAAWTRDATLIGSSDAKLSTSDSKLADHSMSSSWLGPPSDNETSALGLHILEPLPTPHEEPDLWQQRTDPAPAYDAEPRAPTSPTDEARTPAPPITSVWPLRRPSPAATPAPVPLPSGACLDSCRIPSDARVVNASYAATPRAVSYGTAVRDESYTSPVDMPHAESASAQEAPILSKRRSYPPVSRKAPPPVEGTEPLAPAPETAPAHAAPAPALFTSNSQAQGLRAPLDYSVPFPLLFKSRRGPHGSGRAERRLSSIDVPREAPPVEEVRGRASLDERRLPSQSTAREPLRSFDELPALPTMQEERGSTRPALINTLRKSRAPVSQAPARSPLVGSPVPPTPPPKSWLAPATTSVPRASGAPPYARDYGVVQPPLLPLQGAPIESKEGRHVWLDADPDHSHLSMLGAVNDMNEEFHFESYFEHSLQRIRAELAQIHADTPPRRSAAKAAAQEAARVAARAGVQPSRPTAAAPINLTHNAPPVSMENVGSPLMSLDEFTYVMDENGVALSTPHLGVRSPSEPPTSTAPALPPLDTYLPEEHEVMGDPLPVSWVFHDEDRSAFADDPMPTDYRLPLEFVTKPNSVLSRGRPVKKTEQESIFYGSGPDVRRRRAGPRRTVPMWNFEEGDEDAVSSPPPAPAPASAPRAASPPLLHDSAAPPVTEMGRVDEEDTRKRRGKEGADPKFASWWRRKMPASSKAASAAPSGLPNEALPTSEASSEARTSTSTNNTMKYGRRTAPPGFEPSQPGKYFLAGTVSLPTLNIARTPEQRARHETGLAETEPYREGYGL
ncbi:hypothetical protein MEQU1_002957 [Malassezia equina]|uniref:Uncharacterized protein n=1 Tax=Malassezia equina TaxID=1381935 RepID=A0AAF0EGL7_9BASI|nr:hypothetical protein MEQU1_002957 [Malassezia equina]